MSKMSKEHFALHLHRTGSIFRETAIVLAELSNSNSWEKTRKSFLDNRILQKGSRKTEIGILDEIKRRYIQAPEWLPTPTQLGQFLSRSISERAKNQSLLVYTYHADYIIQNIFKETLIPNLANSFILRNSVVVELLNRLKDLTDAHWSNSTLKKWTVKFKTMLRETGFLKDNLLTKPYIREETFAFFLFWLFGSNRSIRKSLKHKALIPLCLTDEDKTYLLKKGNEKGWWYYTKGAGVVEFIARFKNLEEWIYELG